MENDKSKKSVGEEVDISNGSLFLMIKNLERKIQGLELEIKHLKPMIDQSYGQTMRIGGQ